MRLFRKGPTVISPFRNMLWKTESSLTRRGPGRRSGCPERAWETERKFTSSPSSRILPSSGRWKPVIVLSRVLLPAPLSPISPSTSPSLTCRSTPLRTDSTEVLDYALDTQEVRAVRGAVLHHAPPCAAQPRDVDVEDHGYKDGDAQDDVVGVGAMPCRVKPLRRMVRTSPEERASNGPDPTSSAVPP